jgi:exopolyphosphatase/guanosine-5'-triphosphate,3'-diphosphate pyrophosphatase
VLELGANSFHLLVVESAPGGRFRMIVHEKRRVQLGSDCFRSGHLSAVAFERGLDAARDLCTVLEQSRADVTIAVATSAIRHAENGRDFVDRVAQTTGVHVSIIDGLEEARLTYVGARHELGDAHRRLAIFDFGGGSTEVVVAEARNLRFRTSLDVGALRLRSHWECADPPTAEDIHELERMILDGLAPGLERARAFELDAVVFSCGTARKLLRLPVALSWLACREPGSR